MIIEWCRFDNKILVLIRLNYYGYCCGEGGGSLKSVVVLIPVVKIVVCKYLYAQLLQALVFVWLFYI